MDNLVKLLPDNIANQIAAGEVIQRPASVVKELVENAIDAGATEIQVHIKDAGKTLIQVIDNGKGMAPMDARMAFERHATSKIEQAEDLFALTTLGFRGEALPSIAAVSHVTLQTRTADSEQGVRIELEGSRVISSTPVSCAGGSNFAVKHLFFNVPARRKFLKQDTTEFRHIVSEIQNVAAVRPEVGFTLWHNEVLTLQLPPTSVKQRVVDLFGKRLSDTLLTVQADTPLVRIYGFVSKVTSTRKRGALQYFFTNERFMRHPYFHRMVMNAYGNMIPRGEQPEYFLYLTVDPGEIDVNISPTKTEIKFSSEQDIGSILYSSAREALMLGAAVPTLEFSHEGEQIEIPLSKEIEKGELTEPPATPDFLEVTSRLSSPASYEYGAPLLAPDQFDMPDLSDWDSFYKEFESKRSGGGKESTSLAKAAPANPSLPLQDVEYREEESLPEPWIYGSYAIFPSEKGLTLLNTKNAKSTVIYHTLKRSLARGTILSRGLLFPSLIDLNLHESSLLKSHRGSLLRLGFDISDMGQETYAINALPDGISPGTEEQLLRELLAECDTSSKAPEETLLDRLVLILTESRTRHLSPLLSPAEALKLYTELRQIPEHLIAPNGKPTLTTISAQEIDKRFR